MDTEKIATTLAAVKMNRNYRAGESVFREGDPPEGIFFVESGTVALASLTAMRKTGAKSDATSGAILGMSEVATGKPHQYSAIATSSCEISFVPRAEFLHALEETPDLWFTVLNFLSKAVNSAYDDIRAIPRRLQRTPL